MNEHDFHRLLLERLEAWEHKQIKLIENIMAAFDDLTTAVNGLGTAVTTLTASVDKAVTELQTLPPTDAQLAAVTTTINGLTSAITAQTARLVTATTPVPPPIPTPTPTP